MAAATKPPKEVPPTTWNIEAIVLPVLFSSSMRMISGMRQRIPPPSIDKILIRPLTLLYLLVSRFYLFKLAINLLSFWVINSESNWSTIDYLVSQTNVRLACSDQSCFIFNRFKFRVLEMLIMFWALLMAVVRYYLIELFTFKRNSYCLWNSVPLKSSEFT